MEAQAQALVALDIVSALFMAVVAVQLAWAAVMTRRATPALLAAGLGIVAVTYPTVAASQLDLGRQPDVWDHLRIVGQTGGALVILFAYLSSRRTGHARPLLVVGWTAAAVTLLYAFLFFALQPMGTFPPLQDDLAAAHVLMAIAYALTAGLAASSGRSPTLVPVAFGGLTLTKIAWIFVDLGARSSVLLYGLYATRLFALGALFIATLPLARRTGGGSHAQA